MSTRCVGIVAAMVVLTLVAGCGKAAPTAISVPPTDTPVPPAATTVLLTETSAPSDGDGLIVFHSERDGNMEIYVMNTDQGIPGRRKHGSFWKLCKSNNKCFV
jgi:hypothetical protein